MVTATNQLQIVASLTDRLSGPMKKTEKNTARLEKQFTKLSGAVQNAFQFYVRYRIFGLINRGISAVENAIPGLVARGQEWAQTVDSIADSSGLAAEKSSLLAAQAQVMTGDAEGLTKALGALSQQAVNHGDVMRRYGIETRDSNGQLLDTWTILKNVRKATSDLGNGFITTAVARDMFSRGGQTMLDWLTMTPKQVRILTRDLKRMGVIMTDAALQAADQWGRTQRRFEMQITGIANQIVSHVQPLLSKLVDNVTNYLQKNMAQIVEFVVGAISFVAGAVAGFLGFDISDAFKTQAEQMDDAADKSNKRERQLAKAAKTRDEQTSTEDGYTEALNRQIDAIDRQLAKMAKVDRAQDARREHARLMKDIADAQKELRDLRGESVFAAGMSAAEAELARQAHAADIIDAQKNIKEARERLAEQERKTERDNLRTELQERKAALQERLSDHIRTLAEEAKADREVLGQLMGADQGGAGAAAKEMEKVLQARNRGLLQADIGKKWGEDFRAKLDGWLADINDPETGLGGLLQDAKNAFDFLIQNADKAALALGAIAVINLANNFLGLATALGGGTLGGAVGLIGAVGLAAAAVLLFKDRLDIFNNDVERQQAAVDAKIEEYRGTPGGRSLEDLRANVESGLGKSGPGRGLTGIERTFALGQIEGKYATFAENIASDQSMTQSQLAEASSLLNGVIGQLGEEGSDSELFDDLKTHTAVIDDRLKGMSTEVADAVGPDGPLVQTSNAVATALGEDGPMAAVASKSGLVASRLAPAGGGNLVEHAASIASSVAGLNTNLPWGVANISLIIGRREALKILGVPIERTNSTTRRRTDT
jgi:hypothetical protein